MHTSAKTLSDTCTMLYLVMYSQLYSSDGKPGKHPQHSTLPFHCRRYGCSRDGHSGGGGQETWLHHSLYSIMLIHSCASGYYKCTKNEVTSTH